MSDRLKSGVFRAELTARPGPVLQGHWGAPPSSAILRPLEIRAVVFECGGRRAAIATVDVVGVTQQMTDRIRATVERAHAIPADGVMVVASHTHCAPATLPCMGLMPSPEWIASIEREAADCIGRAVANLQHVHLGVGVGEVHFNHSRRNLATLATGAEPVDRRTRVLRIVSEDDGSNLATIFHYACHATVISGLRGLVSPDYPGVSRDLVDAAIGGLSLFLPGCGGDLRPVLDDLRLGVAEARARLAECGRQLAAEVCRIALGIDARESGPVHVARVDVDVPFADPLPIERLRELADDASDRGRRLTGPWAQKVLRLIETQSVPRARRTEMQAIAVGPVMWIGIPGEPLQAIGAALEARLPSLAVTPEIWPVGYANDEIGYFCTSRQYAEGGYEPSAYAFYDEPAPFCGEEDAILDAAARLTSDRAVPLSVPTAPPAAACQWLSGNEL